MHESELRNGGKWMVGAMARTKNGKLLCNGRGCHRISMREEVTYYEPKG